ncbi:hypothetical protein V8D89_012830 [Ganoderma adspersum]
MRPLCLLLFFLCWLLTLYLPAIGSGFYRLQNSPLGEGAVGESFHYTGKVSRAIGAKAECDVNTLTTLRKSLSGRRQQHVPRKLVDILLVSLKGQFPHTSGFLVGKISPTCSGSPRRVWGQVS